jgi:hypothetical protein
VNRVIAKIAYLIMVVSAASGLAGSVVRVIAKIAFFLLVVVAVGAANSYVINGPLLEHNTAISMMQFSGTPAPAGDFQIGGYWLTFNTIYLLEVIGITLLAALLFLPHMLGLLYLNRNVQNESESYIPHKKW